MAQQGEHWRGLKAISAVTAIGEAKLLTWTRDNGFPMIRQEDEWTLSAEDLEQWARGRLEAERRCDKERGEIVTSQATWRGREGKHGG